MARKYPEDVPDVSLWQWYHRVKETPYIFDPPGDESIARVSLALKPGWHFRDCDDKTVAIVAWLEKFGKPYRIVVTGENPDGPPHHVYAETLTNLGWLPLDATFPDNPAHRPKGEEPSRLGLRQYHAGVVQRFRPKNTFDDSV